MAEETNLDSRFRKLTVEHAELRWLMLRVDDGVEEMHENQARVRAVQGEHTARLDSIDSQLRSLTQLVGQVLDRLPEQRGGDS